MVKFWNVGLWVYTHPLDPSAGQSPRLGSDRGPARRPLGTGLAASVVLLEQKMNEPAKEGECDEGKGAGAGTHEEDDVDWLHGDSSLWFGKMRGRHRPPHCLHGTRG